jgi:hypothetical protein
MTFPIMYLFSNVKFNVFCYKDKRHAFINVFLKKIRIRKLKKNNTMAKKKKYKRTNNDPENVHRKQKIE